MISEQRVLIADDEPCLVEELSAYLTDLGHQIAGTASCGRELLQKADECDPTLVVTDIKMPGVDGLEAIERMFEQRHVPVVVVTAYHDEEYVQRATQMKRCVMSYLVKPIDENALKTSITVAIRQFAQI